MALCSLGVLTAGAQEERRPGPVIHLQDTDRTQQAGGELSALRELVSVQGRADIIVGLTTPISAPEVVGKATYRAQKRAFRDAADALSGRVFAEPPKKKQFRPFSVVPYVAMTVTPSELERVLAATAVDTVQAEGKIPIVPRLNEMVDLTQADYMWSGKRANKGKGHAIAVIDIGFDTNLPSMKKRIVHEACFTDLAQSIFGCVVNDKGDRKTKAIGKGAAWGCKDSAAIWAKKNKKRKVPKYCFRHGTQAASAAAATAAKVKNFPAFENGFAPKANLVLVREAGGRTKDLVKSIEHVFKKRKDFKIRATTMSIGLGRATGTCKQGQYLPAVEAAIAMLVDSGVPFFNSAGNDGSNKDIDYPGCLENVVSVGASEESDKKIAKFSDTSHGVDFLAPGDKIGLLDIKDTISGTSFTAPAVAAGYTLLKAANKKKKPDEILSAMSCTGKQLSRKGTDVALPRIDLKKAHQLLQDSKPKLSWNFEDEDDALGWVSHFADWEVKGGNLVLGLHPDLFHAFVFNDLCFEDFELEVRMRNDADDADVRRGIFLAEEAKQTNKDPKKRKYSGIWWILEDAEFSFLAYFNEIVFNVDGDTSHKFESVVTLCRVTDATPLATGEYNTHKVVVKGNTVSVFANGEQICSEDFEGSGFKSFGIYAETRDFPWVEPGEWHVDRVSMKGL